MAESTKPERPDPRKEKESQVFADREMLLANLSAARFDLSGLVITYYLVKADVSGIQINNGQRNLNHPKQKIEALRADIRDKRQMIDTLLVMLETVDNGEPLPEPTGVELEVP